MVRRIEVNQVHHVPVGKLQRRNHQGTVPAIGIKIGQHESICPDVKSQGMSGLVLLEDQVMLTDTGPELNSIPRAEQYRINNRVASITNIKKVGIASDAADQLIVAMPAGQGIVPCESRDPIHHIRAGDEVVTVGPYQIKST